MRVPRDATGRIRDVRARRAEAQGLAGEGESDNEKKLYALSGPQLLRMVMMWAVKEEEQVVEEWWRRAPRCGRREYKSRRGKEYRC